MYGMDWGAGNFRLFGDGGAVLVPSHVSQRVGKEYRANEVQASQEMPLRIQVEDTEFFVGTGAPHWGRPVDNLDDSRFASGSPELRALLYAVLSKAQVEDGQMELLVGLPQSAWEADREPPETPLREWLVGEHAWQCDGEPCSVKVERVGVVSQVVGALYDHILDDEGRPIQENVSACWGQETAVVSVGFSTLELHAVTLAKRPVVSPRFTASETAGVRRLLRLADPVSRYTLAELDDRLRTDGAFVQPYIGAWGAEVIGLIEQRWDDNWQRFARVIVVGGGSILLRDQLSQFFEGRAHFASSPIFAVAMGLYKLGRASGQAQS